MKLFRNKNFIYVICLLLLAFFCIPSIVKTVHALFEHEHFECAKVGELHLHEVELDCDFHDFNLSPQFYATLEDEQKLEVSPISNKTYTRYSFLSKYQKLHFTLRGPPSAS
jgi:hypothetical protein